MSDAVTFNPFDPAFRADPYPTYDRLRAEAPLLRSPIGLLVLSRYDDVAKVLRSPVFGKDLESFAAVPGGSLFGNPNGRRRGGRKSMLSLDPPDHTRLRTLVTKAFTPTAIERLRPRITELVDRARAPARDRGTLELISEVAFPVPFQVISDLLAMPVDRATEVRDWAQAITLLLEPACTAAQVEAGEAAGATMNDYLLEVIDDRRHHLGDDVLSALILAEEAGDRLSADELVATVLLLYVAGHETTVNLIGNGMLALLRAPDQLAAWRSDPALAANAVDELLRADGPVQFTVRVAMDDVEVGGEKIARGTPVMPLLGAANHDPAVFANPHRLDLRRANANKHLAFAAGIHYCLGSALARAEAQIALGRIVETFSTTEAIGEPHWRDRLTIRGVDRLELAVAV
jgi:cytochrome P450